MNASISQSYLSIINKQGSGYDIPLVVDAIVDAVIVPSKSIVTNQKTKVDASISGMATLKASMSLRQNSFSVLTGDGDYPLTSSDTSAVSLTVANRSKVGSFDHKITDIITAKPKTMSVSGWDTSTHNYSRSSLAVSVNGGTPVTVDTAGGNATTITAQLNAITGLNASLIKVTDGDYRMLISGLPGQDFSITASGSDSNKMNTSGHSSNTVVEEVGASLKIDGVAVNRASNTFTDLINGVSLTLVADKSAETRVSASKSSANIQKTVQDLIAQLNTYKADLSTLGFLDLTGDNDGSLANSQYLKSAQRNLANLMRAPISGFGDTDIYFVDFGISTAANGAYIFNQRAFDSTYLNAPEKFEALTQDKDYSSNSQLTVANTSNSRVKAGKYNYTASDNNLRLAGTSDIVATLSSSGTGPWTFKAATHAGFLFRSSVETPTDSVIYLGRSGITKLENLFADVLVASGSHDTTVSVYESKSKNLASRLDKLTQREAVLKAQYTTKFSNMEKLVTDSKSSASLIENFIGVWDKKK